MHTVVERAPTRNPLPYADNTLRLCRRQVQSSQYPGGTRSAAADFHLTRHSSEPMWLGKPLEQQGRGQRWPAHSLPAAGETPHGLATISIRPSLLLKGDTHGSSTPTSRCLVLALLALPGLVRQSHHTLRANCA